jgi:hypothetical protein
MAIDICRLLTYIVISCRLNRVYTTLLEATFAQKRGRWSIPFKDTLIDTFWYTVYTSSTVLLHIIGDIRFLCEAPTSFKLVCFFSRSGQLSTAGLSFIERTSLTVHGDESGLPRALHLRGESLVICVPCDWQCDSTCVCMAIDKPNVYQSTCCTGQIANRFVSYRLRPETCQGHNSFWPTEVRSSFVNLQS